MNLAPASWVGRLESLIWWLVWCVSLCLGTFGLLLLQSIRMSGLTVFFFGMWTLARRNMRSDLEISG
jgi:hypothetical protein